MAAAGFATSGGEEGAGEVASCALATVIAHTVAISAAPVTLAILFIGISSHGNVGRRQVSSELFSVAVAKLYAIELKHSIK
jgi:hypothetical protein